MPDEQVQISPKVLDAAAEEVVDEDTVYGQRSGKKMDGSGGTRYRRIASVKGMVER